MRTFVYPYTADSESAKLLAQDMGVRRLKLKNSAVKDAADLAIINWGAGSLPYHRAKIFNKPDKVAVAANKLRCFQALKLNKKINIPDFTTDMEEAKEWLAVGAGKQYDKVCIRKLLNASGGKGLVIVDRLEDIVKAPLYVEYIPKLSEYRVHVIDGGVVRCQRKVWPEGKDKRNVNWQIRNHEHGFIFQIAQAVPHPSIFEQAVLACGTLGLDFGGVDIIWNERNQRATVLEVNTAPGIEGGTVEVYTNEFKKMIERLA